jgi:hypothetical protein
LTDIMSWYIGNCHAIFPILPWRWSTITDSHICTQKCMGKKISRVLAQVKYNVYLYIHTNTTWTWKRKNSQ